MSKEIIISSISLVIAVVSAFLSWFQYRTNKKVAKSNLDLKKCEHIAFINKKWQEIKKIVEYVPNYSAKIIAKDEIMLTFKNIVEEIEIQNIKTDCLFNDKVKEKQNKFLSEIKGINPDIGLDGYILDITDNFIQLVQTFENLNKLYAEQKKEAL